MLQVHVPVRGARNRRESSDPRAWVAPMSGLLALQGTSAMTGRGSKRLAASTVSAVADMHAARSSCGRTEIESAVAEGIHPATAQPQCDARWHSADNPVSATMNTDPQEHSRGSATMCTGYACWETVKSA